MLGMQTFLGSLVLKKDLKFSGCCSQRYGSCEGAKLMIVLCRAGSGLVEDIGRRCFIEVLMHVEYGE